MARTADNYYEKIFTHANTGMARVGIDGSWLEVNDKLCDIVGYSREALLQLSFQDITHPDDLNTDLKYVQQLLNNERDSYSMEKRYVHKLGSIVWTNLTVSLIRDDANNPEYFITIIDDISELYQTRSELTKQRKLLQEVIDTVPVRVFWKDRDLRYLGCNPAFARDSGNTAPDDLIGKDDYQMGWEEQAERYRADDSKVIESGEAILGFEEPQTTPEGKTIWLRTSKVPLINDDGEVYGVLGIYDDITEQREAQEQLKEKESYQRALLDNFPFLVWLKDIHSRFLSVNEPFARSTDFASADELIGKSDLDIWPEDLAEAYLKDDREVLRTGRKKNLEEEVSINGVRRWFETYKAPIVDDQNQILGTVGFARDITERKHMEQELIDKEFLLKEAQHIAHLGNWELDPSTMKAKWSDEVFAILGREPREDVGPEFLQGIVHQEDRDSVIESLQCAATQGTKHHMQYRIHRPNGDVRWLECEAIQKYDHNHKLQLLRGVIQDITQKKQYELQLRESEKHYRALFEQMPSAVAVYRVIEGGQDFIFQDFNRAAERIERINRADLIGKRVTEAFPGVHSSGVFNIFGHVRDTGETKYNPQYYYQDARNPGSWRESWTYKLSDDYIVTVYNDITERKRIESDLRTLSQAIEQSPVSVVITDPDGLIEYVNGVFESITGYSLDDVKGQNPRLLKSGATPEGVYRRMWQAITGGQSWEGEFQNRKKDGSIFWEYAHIAPVVNEHGIIEHYVAVKEDITSRKRDEEQILHQAHFDSLTDLPNRFLSMDRLAQLLNESKRSKDKVGVLFIDLDDFKKVNDTLGHEVGDKLLIEASRRLLGAVRTGDTVGRLSGDEFIVLLSGLTKPTDAQAIAEKLLESFRKLFEIDGRELIITASIGIAIYPNDSDTTSGLLRNADSAMYHSKESGRNTFSFFTEAMNHEVAKRLAIEEQIHGALERGEFSVHYQPQVEVDTGNIVGAEALLRWHNPALGRIPPCEFIPIAEQTGLIIKLGEYVLEQALMKTAVWQDEHIPAFRIAVNISPRQFLRTNLFEDIRRLLEKYDIKPQHLELEITEGLLMGGHAYIDETLDKITKLGIHIAMDDFGTGYSSLSYLRSYPFQVLKVDQSFIQDIGIDQADRELINAAISMAHGLQMVVIAEGVETREQLDYLKAHSCDYAQGYFFSKPLTSEQMSHLLEAKRTLP